MNVSKITIDDVKNYLKIDNNDENEFLELVLASAISYVKSYTGLTIEKLDNHEEISIVIYILCADFFDNRSLKVDKASENPTVLHILSLYRINYL